MFNHIKHIADMKVYHTEDHATGKDSVRLEIKFGVFRLNVYLTERMARNLAAILLTPLAGTEVHGYAESTTPPLTPKPLTQKGHIFLDGDTLNARKVVEYKPNEP